MAVPKLYFGDFPLTSQINSHSTVLFISLKCYDKNLKNGEIYGLVNVSSVKNSSLSKLRQVVNFDWPPFGPVISWTPLLTVII